MLTIGLTGCSKKTSPGNSAAASSQATSAAASGSGAAAGQCPTSNTTPFAKSKFVAHTGLAFGAFHRYLYKPLRAGGFAHGSHGRILAFVKAALAAAFITHEVRLAAQDARANPTLCRLVAAPLADIANTVRGAVTALRGGDSSGVSAINNMIGSTENSSGHAGAPITESSNPNIGG